VIRTEQLRLFPQFLVLLALEILEALPPFEEVSAKYLCNDDFDDGGI
jgi:hypothetical protein